MKINKLTLILIIVSFLVSCKTQQLYLSVVEPAPVTVPSSIKKVGIINRTMPTDESKGIDAIDKFLSLEGANLDKDGAEESVKGLEDQLGSNERFTEVKALKDMDFRTPKLTLFPAPLSWEIVDQVCKETGLDAIFSLEKFDTDTHISYTTRNVNIKTPLGSVPGLEHQAHMQTLVKTGWRIYDPVDRQILDEYVYEQSIESVGKGINPVLAAAALIGRKEAVNEVSYKAGQGYAMRILPYKLRVMRDYYVKGTDNFKIAKRKAQMGKWDEAGQLWEKETNNPKAKIAGRAAYNMAIINEINGDLEAALKWAQKSYEDYNDRYAIRYTRILENRLYKTDILKMQGQQ
jgi:hypothetical protein